jgi:hypothetical protein
MAPVLPSALGIDARGPPGLLPQAVEGVTVQRAAVLRGEQQLARD